MTDVMLHLEILLPAFLAGLVILVTHIPLGSKVLSKGIIFFDLAIAQLAAFGVVLSSLVLDFSDATWTVHAIALLTALSGACLLYALRKHSIKFQEAVIGTIFLLSSTGVLLVLTQDSSAHETFQQLMLGQILWVSYEDVLTLCGYTLVLIITWRLIQQFNKELAFYITFALTITMSTQFIGVYLVFASLIIPALASQKFQHRWLVASLVGISSYLVGLLLSALLDLPSGALISWCMVVMGALVFMLMPLRTNPKVLLAEDT
ncbi:metal ABC transporter permease [Litoribrevibacter euphylliae]|uniref:Metal ABC transporter permease n=1 Tax=Litoribrevibacter euphylliae TaxID=1834034 RepID=A0ABV7HCL1_9GAMM